ncbi:hypothetical protein QUF75_01925 [Desulfococcaceae bacterium HSG7]|nr:hypothetical protein [Desulfococcaceae bacterium HSG7]
MSPYFFIDIELIDSRQTAGNMILSGHYLELIVKCLESVKWDMRFFSNYHLGEYDSLKGDDLPGMKPLQKFDDITELAENKHSIYLFSEILLKNHLFSVFETNRFTLGIRKNRLTFKIPHWFIRNKDACFRLFKTKFNLIAEFQKIIEYITDTIRQSEYFFLRRANIRFLGVEYLKFRPPFDPFFLSDSTIFEIYHTKRFSSGREMPEYITKLSQSDDFPGVNCMKKDDYVYLQWIKSDYSDWDHYANDIIEILSKRHAWLSSVDFIPKDKDFNKHGDMPLAWRVPLKPENPFVMNKKTAFVEIGISEKNVYSPEKRKELIETIKDLKENKKVQSVNVIVENRNTVFLLLNESLFWIDLEQRKYTCEREINNIYYRDEENKVRSASPKGKWQNNSTGCMTSIPRSAIEKSRSIDIVKSENHITISTFTTITGFKKTENKYIPVWMLWGGMDIQVNRIYEDKNTVDAADGFMGDLTPFTVELQTGKIIDYGEHSNLESIKLIELTRESENNQ